MNKLGNRTSQYRKLSAPQFKGYRGGIKTAAAKKPKAPYKNYKATK